MAAKSKGPDALRVIRELPNSTLRGLDVPRYLPFVALVRTLLKAGVTLRSIAGQTTLQVKVKVPAAIQNIGANLEGCRELGEIPMAAAHGDRYVRLAVGVAQLRPVLDAIEARGGEVTYLHDF